MSLHSKAWLACALLLLMHGDARAEEAVSQADLTQNRTDRRNAVHLDPILEQVRLANHGTPNFEELQATLQRLVDVLKEATGDKELKLPVQFADVQPKVQNRSPLRALIVGGVVRQKVITQSIVLADTAAEIRVARDSIIIARVAINVRSCYNCIVVAGQSLYCDLGVDSVLMSGNEGELINGKNPLFGCGGQCELWAAQPATLVNCTNNRQQPVKDLSIVKTDGLVLKVVPPLNPLASKIAVTFSSPNPNGPILFRLLRGGGEYVARIDQEINSPDGTAIPEIKDWRVPYASYRFAVFVHGDQQAYMQVTK